MYSEALLDYFQNPRNPGDLADPDASAQMENPVCGDVLRLTLKVDDGRIAEIRFKAKGCVPAIACGSAITTLARGKTVAEALKVRPEQLVELLGGLPEASAHASVLAVETLSAALKKLRSSML